jgi:hypothetical protein
MTRMTDASEMPDAITNPTTPRDQFGDAIAGGLDYMISESQFIDSDGYFLTNTTATRVTVTEDESGDYWIQPRGSETRQRVDQMARKTYWWRIDSSDQPKCLPQAEGPRGVVVYQIESGADLHSLAAAADKIGCDGTLRLADGKLFAWISAGDSHISDFDLYEFEQHLSVWSVKFKRQD